MEQQFKIFELTKQLVDEIKSRTYDSHYHDFEEILIVTDGSLEHIIDFKTEIVEGIVACYVPMGKMHKLIPHDNLRGWVINYQTELVPNSSLKFYSNFFASNNISINIDLAQSQIIPLCNILYAESQKTSADIIVLSAILTGLIALLDSERKKQTVQNNQNGYTNFSTINNFLKIINENYSRPEGVKFYADKLNMSERNLNTICNNIFKKSVSEIIETRKLVEAKNLLLHSSKSISEIGFEIGYNEKSYFTRVFKNKTGITPSEFREYSRNIIS